MSRQDLAVEQKILRALKAAAAAPRAASSPPKAATAAKRVGQAPRHVLLALSGGVDSMVMAQILWKWRVGLRMDLQVAHVHHGAAGSAEQSHFRDRAQTFVGEWAKTHQLPFFTNAPSAAPPLKSEAQMRVFRERCLAEWAIEGTCDAVAYAHHSDDLLETRMIRLIRGSGTQGLRSMSVWRGRKLRPLLPLSNREIRAYADARKLSWLEDPSNTRAEYLRNWLRRDWLPDLEQKRPGALKALARSLETMAPRSQDFHLAPYVGLRREVFSSQPVREQRALLAAYLKEMGLKGYAQTHIDEILKRLSTGRGNSAFEMLGLRFTISPEFLWASRV